ncbi:YesK family protein [Saccharibacillus kuerlensis]|uniref:YesK family protein n=1 Tax=Saccharibacillus kuerlensis TaxID=459527 RepID=UPI00035E89A1|nr:YesK family protein [Saccharibacillus kuerlensis]
MKHKINNIFTSLMGIYDILVGKEVFKLNGIVLLSVSTFIILMGASYLIYKKYPYRQQLTYIPSGTTLLTSFIMIFISFDLNRFDGLTMSAASVAIGLASLAAFMCLPLIDYYFRYRQH